MIRSIALISFIIFFIPVHLLAQNNARVYWNSGNAKFNIADYSGAILDYNKAIEIDPVYLNAYINRGLSEVRLKNYRAALRIMIKP
jgi:tetratricopeptide (TPR) repeat protein